ncbi:hypothetical protein HG531_005449 [Fusarium graminearum]|nr:hypothetical protein HG531_005449 [Fusarium graminearum]
MVVHERATVHVLGQWVTHRVHNQALFKLGGVNLPNLLDTKAVSLVLAIPSQVELVDNLLAQTSVAAFAEHGDSGMELHASLECFLGLAVTANTKIVGGNTLDRAICMVDNLGSSKARVDLNTDLFSTLAEPLDELVQADDVVSVVGHLRRRGDRNSRVLGKESHTIGAGGSGMFESVGVVLVEPVGEQFIDSGRLDDSSREDMSAKIASLFQDKHAEVLVSSIIGELLKTNSSAETSRTASYNADINLVRLAFDGGGVEICVVVSKS